MILSNALVRPLILFHYSYETECFWEPGFHCVNSIYIDGRLPRSTTNEMGLGGFRSINFQFFFPNYRPTSHGPKNVIKKRYSIMYGWYCFSLEKKIIVHNDNDTTFDNSFNYYPPPTTFLCIIEFSEHFCTVSIQRSMKSKRFPAIYSFKLNVSVASHAKI